MSGEWMLSVLVAPCVVGLWLIHLSTRVTRPDDDAEPPRPLPPARVVMRR